MIYIDPSGNVWEWAGNAWEKTTDFVDNIQWSEVGWGTLQAAGGGFEIAGGLTLATGGTAASGGILGGLTITAGGLLMVDGVSNASGGFSRAYNGLMGNDKGETMNFIKNGFVAASSKSGG